jgi:hypothetical protein
VATFLEEFAPFAVRPPDVDATCSTKPKHTDPRPPAHFLKRSHVIGENVDREKEAKKRRDEASEIEGSRRDNNKTKTVGNTGSLTRTTKVVWLDCLPFCMRK